MHEKIIKSILNSISESEEDISKSIEYKGILLSRDSIKRIELSGDSGSVGFVDGGNAELIAAPNFSLHFIRLYGVVLEGSKRVSSTEKEVYCLVRLSDGKYEAVFFPERKGFVFNVSEFEDLSQVGSHVRRLLELEFAASVVSDVLVLDGSLYTKGPVEKELMQSLKSRNLVGFSKTTRDVTAKGNSVVGFLNRIADFNGWYCEAGSYDDVVVYFANFASNYIFKIETNCGPRFSELFMNSRDYVFPGYPYGLVLVDKFARVSNKEKEYLITMLKTKSGQNWKRIEQSVVSLNAHDILDNIC